MNKIVYVTGCLGFIGSYVTKKCLQRNWKVYGVDKCTYAANMEMLEDLQKHRNFAFQKCDIKDLDHLYDCDYVINTATVLSTAILLLIVMLLAPKTCWT